MNLYLHFPFCTRKCTYCALHSRVGVDEEARERYVRSLSARVGAFLAGKSLNLDTVYFGGGSPAMCHLEPLFEVLSRHLAGRYEFTVELHPENATREVLEALKKGGVNRVSMGVQSADDAVLERMRRHHTFKDAQNAFALVKEYFDNAGIDLIAGLPGEEFNVRGGGDAYERLSSWGIKHASIYSLIVEEKSVLGMMVKNGRITPPDDDSLLDRIACFSRLLPRFGLRRYEISSWAVPGFECRHNLAVWRGEDYAAFGEGAYGRMGLERWTTPPASGNFTGDVPAPEIETVSQKDDLFERTAFRLRTRDGIDASLFPEWREILDFHARSGLLEGSYPRYTLTPRGTEVCDSILAELK